MNRTRGSAELASCLRMTGRVHSLLKGDRDSSQMSKELQIATGERRLSGDISPESLERELALARGSDVRGIGSACVPDVPGLEPERIYSLVAESTREYAIFLMDRDGIIRCWGESAR